jgi:hypothetical protein
MRPNSAAGNHESDFLSGQFGFHLELAARLRGVVQNEIAHYPGP